MSININNQIWQLIEKLYIHCYELDGFIQLLNTNNIKLPSNFYKSFEIYSFMSTEQNRFAQYMQQIPSYRYIPIITNVCLDENIKSTRRDNWNYYGVFIKSWHPKLIRLLKQTGFEIDLRKNKLTYPDNEKSQIQINQDFLEYNLIDPFLEHIKKEINENYNDERYLSVVVLSRKLIECLLIRIFEVVFRKNDENGKYNECNHLLWYDKSRSRTQDLSVLLENLKSNSTAFHEDKDLIEDICNIVKTIKNEMNKTIHRDYKIPVREDIYKINIKVTINMLGRMFRKYCNP